MMAGFVYAHSIAPALAQIPGDKKRLPQHSKTVEKAGAYPQLARLLPRLGRWSSAAEHLIQASVYSSSVAADSRASILPSQAALASSNNWVLAFY